MRMFVRHRGSKDLLQKIHYEFYGCDDWFVRDLTQKELDRNPYYIFDTEDDDIGRLETDLPHYKEYIIETIEGEEML